MYAHVNVHYVHVHANNQNLVNLSVRKCNDRRTNCAAVAAAASGRAAPLTRTGIKPGVRAATAE